MTNGLNILSVTRLHSEPGKLSYDEGRQLGSSAGHMMMICSFGCYEIPAHGCYGHSY